MTVIVSSAHDASTGQAVRRRMVPRSIHESHRVATPLELFFDLVFVVAIAQAAGGLHHAMAEGHAIEALAGYAMVFFAIWWAWMNFTWFASAYDCDDVPYRLAVFVQMAGALILAAGVADMFATHIPNAAVVFGYVVMRCAGIAQWLRAAAADRERRTTAHRYALGVALVQCAWVTVLVMPAWLVTPAFVAFAAMELAVPVWAERAGRTSWHPHHIAERYGLLTLIVLGESILAATVATQAALASGEAFSPVIPLIIGGLLIVNSMWWIYFDRPVHDVLTSSRKAMVWGYGHYFVFASAAAVGAGLAAAVDHATHRGHASALASDAAVAVPVAIFLTAIWILHDQPDSHRTRMWGPVVAGLVLVTPFTGHGVLLTGVLLAAAVATKIAVARPRRSS